jgi:DNA-binding transcriptional LysR family regulator
MGVAAIQQARSIHYTRDVRSRMPDLALAAVRSLVLAVDTGSLTDAGRRLGLTPSAISKQLSRLEAALGARLLERTTRRVRPTAAGQALVQRTRPLFEAFDEAGAAVRDLQTDVRGRVRVSASRAWGRLRLMPIVARLALAHPHLEIDVVLDARRLDFVDDDVDLAVREGPLADASWTARRLGSFAVHLYASPAYGARRRFPRALEDLRHHDVLAVPPAGPASDLAALRGRAGRRLGLVPRIRVNDLIGLADLAESGAGIAVLPDYVAAPGVARGTLVRVLPRTTLARLPLHAVFPSRRHLPRRVQIVLDALVEAQA